VIVDVQDRDSDLLTHQQVRMLGVKMNQRVPAVARRATSDVHETERPPGSGGGGERQAVGEQSRHVLQADSRHQGGERRGNPPVYRARLHAQIPGPSFNR